MAHDVVVVLDLRQQACVLRLVLHQPQSPPFVPLFIWIAIKAAYLEQIRKFRLFDDAFFRACFQDDKKGAEFILRIIMDKPDLRVIKSNTQHDAKNLRGHSVILDVYAEDSENRYYDIEVQRDDDQAIPKRARYNSSLMDAQLLSSSQDYSLLPHSYVIFITENDVLEKGLPIYHIERMITETGDPFDDASHIVYVNGTYVDDSALGKLMPDFRCANPDEMQYPFLQEKTRALKETEKGVTRLSKFMEDLREDGRAEGYAQGRADTLEETKEQIAKAEAKAIKAEAKATKAEAKATKAEAKATQAEAKVTEAEAKATKAEAKATQAEEKAAEAKKAQENAEAKVNAIKKVFQTLKQQN